MKRLLLFVLLFIAALTSKAQGLRQDGDTAYYYKRWKYAYSNYIQLNWKPSAELSFRLAICASHIDFYYDMAPNFFLHAIALDSTNSKVYFEFAIFYLNAARLDRDVIINPAYADTFALETHKKNYVINRASAELYLKKAIDLGDADAKHVYDSLNSN